MSRPFLSVLSFLLFLTPLIASSIEPSPDSTSYDATEPKSWHLSAKLGPGMAQRLELCTELSAPTDEPGQLPLTPDEVNAILDDPRAERIYGSKTVAIMAPSMVARQTRGHVDLLSTLLAPRFLAQGARFAQAHEASLSASARKHGVPKEAIISILMWETRLGAVTGGFSLFNTFASQAFFIDEASALATAAADETEVDPAAQAARVEKIRKRARANLLALLRASKAQGLDPLALKGSWAGAMGYPQFMPTSLRWAEDGNGDGKIDLYDADDAIASVARYLEEHGWAESPEKAVWGYNHEQAYVAGVLRWADALHEHLDAPPKSHSVAQRSGKKSAARKRAK